MQLKRDTDYAVRILYCLYLRHTDDDSNVKNGLTLSEIAMQARVPKAVAGRICEYMAEKGFIFLVDDQTAVEKTYYSTEKLLSYSLRDIIKAVEGTVEIFAVFDQRTEMYKKCGDQLLKIQEKTEGLLTRATLETLFDLKTTIK